MAIKAIAAVVRRSVRRVQNHNTDHHHKMKFFILLALFASAATAIPYGGLVNTGQSAVSRSQDVR